METLPNTDQWREKYLQLKQEYEEFAYIVSHDLKAPLRAICNLTGWISEDLGQDLDPDIQHNIRLLQNRSERMEGMINAILAFSRIERSDLEVVDIKVQEVIHNWAKQQLGSEQVIVKAENLPSFKTYAKKLEFVLQQLLDNAVRFNQSNQPQIWVSCLEKEGFYEFTVRDNGIGIPETALEKIFKLFYTVQPKAEAQNLGVGLTLTQKIVRFVGGSLQVTSDLGQGSSFIFTWPKSITGTI